MDLITVLLVTLLTITVAAYLLGLIPYPMGWLVLALLLLVRITQKR